MTRSFLLMCVVAAVLAACGSTPEAVPKAPLSPPSIDRPGAKLVSVTEANAGASVVLEAAQELVVSLPISATGGLEWSVVDLAPGVLALTSAKFERALRNTNVEESAGASVFHFKSQAAGRVTLTFDLRRPRSLLPAVQTVAYQVIVK